MVFTNQAPVVQTVDNAIHRINHYPLDIAIGFAITYSVDRAIHRLNNWGQNANTGLPELCIFFQQICAIFGKL